MSDPCTIQSDCIKWDMPGGLVCDPCLNLDDPDDAAQFDEAWKVAASIVYNKTFRRWPGDCFLERVRPCVDLCACREVSCSGCQYTYLDLGGVTCLPVRDILGVNIGDQGRVWSCDANDFRLEWAGPTPRIVLHKDLYWPSQDLDVADGQAGSWSIDILTGAKPPAEILSATGALANEIVKECDATGCSFVQGAVSVTRRGATFTRRGATLTRDPDEVGEGVWFDLLRDFVRQEKNTIVESFGNVSDGSVSFHRVGCPVAVEVTCDA